MRFLGGDKFGKINLKKDYGPPYRAEFQVIMRFLMIILGYRKNPIRNDKSDKIVAQRISENPIAHDNSTKPPTQQFLEKSLKV